MREKAIRDRAGWTCRVIEERTDGVIVDWAFVGGEGTTRFIPNEEIVWRGLMQVNPYVAERVGEDEFHFILYQLVPPRICEFRIREVKGVEYRCFAQSMSGESWTDANTTS